LHSAQNAKNDPAFRASFELARSSQFGKRKVEANALVAHPEEGPALCREAILKYLPARARRRYLVQLKVVREELEELLTASLRKKYGL
jgi:hypothetical protein